MIALLILACAWPVSAPAPSQPLIVEVAYGGTAEPDSSTEARHTRPEAVDAETAPQAGPGEPQTREANPGVGGDDD